MYIELSKEIVKQEEDLILQTGIPTLRQLNQLLNQLRIPYKLLEVLAIRETFNLVM